ncbi:MAG: hypothetical protein IJ565_00305 [Bacilli bacterium]|nr:hypothetical protein [Bacilli bacterium]
MNVIFLDFDGTLDTIHRNSNEDIERRIAILANICKEYNCKVVIEASAKSSISEDTLETDSEWIRIIFDLFKKYGIECIGRTPNVIRRLSETSYLPIWKEDEIRLYLFRHPEIEHYCILDDDDLYPKNSDLNKVRDHLVKTIYYSRNPDEEGILECHKEEVGKILKKDNNIRKLVLKYKNNID